MDPQNRRVERRKLRFNYEGKYFLFGVIFGIIFFTFWDYSFNHKHHSLDIKEEVAIEQLKVDSNQMLLNYVDGKWISSVKDLIVTIDIDSKKEFLVIENTTGQQRKFKIVTINKVNGILGIIRLEICDVKTRCNEEQYHIPLQLNKIFGLDRTISIAYDSRLAYCSEEDDRCVRGFKRHD